MLKCVPSREPESLARAVSQALQAGQVSHVTDILHSDLSDMVQATVTKLPAEAVLPLLAVIETNFQNGNILLPQSMCF